MSSCILQGRKRPSDWTDGRKKWNKGAPLSKKSKGVGRGFNQGDGGKFVPKSMSVPLPTGRESINNTCTRDFLIDPPVAASEENAAPQSAEQPPVPPPIPVAIALDSS